MPTQEDAPNYSHLTDQYKEPLYTYPRDDPTQQMKAAYTAQKTSRKQYDIAKQSRTQYEVEMSRKLGKLHNLLRESNEREAIAMKTLRSKTINVYEYELQEINGGDTNSKFNIGISKLKQYIKKYKGLPPSLEMMDTDTSKYTSEGYEVATWIASINPTSLRPHQCATLENLGIPLQLTQEDNWHRSLLQFKLFAKEYYATPITVQETNGDLLQTINKKGTEVLKVWCNEQQAQYEANAFVDDMDKYTKLVDAGFTFDVHTDDTKWDEKLGMIQEFHDKFGHVHIPDDYSPKSDSGNTSSQVTASDLQEFVNQVTKLVHRDALSPKRLSSLKKLNLYSDLGGSVYDQHIQQYKSSCRESGVEYRTKRKFHALETMAQSSQIGKMKKVVVRRNNMDNWKAKLEKCVAYKNEHGNVLDIKNDIKLRLWVYSVIRKLTINSSALKGEKLKLIEEHDGLKEFLLLKEHRDAAYADAKARKEEASSGTGKDMEALAENVLLGKEEDHEMNAFMGGV